METDIVILLTIETDIVSGRLDLISIEDNDLVAVTGLHDSVIATALQLVGELLGGEQLVKEV